MPSGYCIHRVRLPSNSIFYGTSHLRHSLSNFIDDFLPIFPKQ